MKINPAPFHLAQSVLLAICIALSIATLGTAAHTLSVFNKQQSSNPWWLPLWPQHFDVHGTEALVGSSAATVVLLIANLVATLVPKFNLANRPTLRGLLSLGTTIPPAIVALITVIYVHILNDNAPESDSIQTWTCKYKSAQPLQQDLALPSGMGNSAFSRLCTESKFALYGTLTVVLLLCASMALTVVTWAADKWVGHTARKEAEMSSQQSL